MTIKVSSKLTLEDAILEIEKRMLGVSFERYKLDELIGELDQLRDNCRTAYDDLQAARDALSELV